MTQGESPVEWEARSIRSPDLVEVEPGVYHGYRLCFEDATTAERLRSGTDGPHSELADIVCGLNDRFLTEG